MSDNDTRLTQSVMPRREPGEPIESWRVRRDGLAAQLAGLAPPQVNEDLVQLQQQLVEAINLISGVNENLGILRKIVEEQAEIIGLLVSKTNAPQEDPPREVELADGRKFQIVGRDMLTLCLGVTVAARTGGTVDLPLADGTIAAGLRIGELASISAQLIEPAE